MTEVIDDLTFKFNSAADKSTPLKKYPFGSNPLAQTIRIVGRYTNAEAIQDLAIRKFKTNGRGITFSDLTGVSKNHAQSTLKYHLKHGNLFTIRASKPQQYYPSSIKAEILDSIYSKSTPVDPTYLGNLTGNISSQHGLSGHAISCRGTKVSLPATSLQPTLKARSLDEVFTHIPFYPLYIHKLQLKLRIDVDYLITDGDDIPQHHKEPLGANSYVTYAIHRNGTICVDLACSSKPFPLAEDCDTSALFSVLGQAKDRLLAVVKDPHERIIPPILDWLLVCFDISKDIPIQHSARIILPTYNPLRDVDRVFRLYVKSSPWVHNQYIVWKNL